MVKGFVVKSIIVAVLLFWLALGGVVVYFMWELPDITELRQYKPNLISRAYSTEGELIAEYFSERRIAIPLEKVPPLLVKAFLAAEDARFFEHHGMDIRGIIRAALKNTLAGGYVQGGSTITQQIARSLFLSKEKTIARKLRELILAYLLDTKFTKQEILQLYLNHIYLGNGAYGIEMAAQDYFAKPVGRLTPAECALLAGLPKAPTLYSPFKNPGKARQRRSYVLARMLELGYITQADFNTAEATPLPKENKRIKNLQYSSHLGEYIRLKLIEKYGEEKVLKGGLTVFTSINASFQRRAFESIDRGLRELDKRQGFRGIIETIPEEKIEAFSKNGPQTLDDMTPSMYARAVVLESNPKLKRYTVRLGNFTAVMPYTTVQWAVNKKTAETLFKKGDVVDIKVTAISKNEIQTALEQDPVVESALISIDPNTGFVQAMVGGHNFIKSQFNRAVQSKRQPGSSFKPFVYGAALEKGYSPVSIFIDSPISYNIGVKNWAPKNFDSKFYGPTSLRHALAKSRNIITIKLLEAVGVQNVIDFAKRAGVDGPLEANLSLALGSNGISLYEMVTSFTTFASMGKRYEPQVILKVVDSSGATLEENIPKSEQVISPAVCYVLTNMLKSVVEEGTATRARVLGRPIAGKTGTTNNYIDAWFVGYTPNLVTGVWVGFDQLKPLGSMETGARSALPIWIDYSMVAENSYPPTDFMVPEGVSIVRLDSSTGLLPSGASRGTRMEVFVEGSEPREAFDPTVHLKKEEYLHLDSDRETKDDGKQEPGW